MSNEEILAGRIEKHLKYERNEPLLLNTDELILCMLALKLQVIDSRSVSDNVCEWHKLKNGNAYKCNTHAEIYDSRVLDWCKCPYCGKNVRVVE